MQTTRLTRDEVKSLYVFRRSMIQTVGTCIGHQRRAVLDVVHHLFLKMLGKKTFVLQSPLAYFYRATRNASLNLRRDRQHETDLQVSQSWFVHPSGNLDEVLNLQQALRDLPEEQRETVFLKVWSGLTLLEISEITQTPLNTVASRYRYALEKLRERLGKRLQTKG